MYVHELCEVKIDTNITCNFKTSSIPPLALPLGVINTVTAIAVMVVFVRVWTNYGKGLREKYCK